MGQWLSSGCGDWQVLLDCHSEQTILVNHPLQIFVHTHKLASLPYAHTIHLQYLTEQALHKSIAQQAYAQWLNTPAVQVKLMPSGETVPVPPAALATAVMPALCRLRVNAITLLTNRCKRVTAKAYAQQLGVGNKTHKERKITRFEATGRMRDKAIREFTDICERVKCAELREEFVHAVHSELESELKQFWDLIYRMATCKEGSMLGESHEGLKSILRMIIALFSATLHLPSLLIALSLLNQLSVSNPQWNPELHEGSLICMQKVRNHLLSLTVIFSECSNNSLKCTYLDPD
jgi:hypothetical protein